MRLTEFTKCGNHAAKETEQPLSQLKRALSMSDISKPSHRMFTIKENLGFSQPLSYLISTLSYRYPVRFRTISTCHYGRQAGAFFYLITVDLREMTHLDSSDFER
jgi:hypothetical protein